VPGTNSCESMHLGAGKGREDPELSNEASNGAGLAEVRGAGDIKHAATHGFVRRWAFSLMTAASHMWLLLCDFPLVCFVRT
jgi:hypothetical protein